MGRKRATAQDCNDGLPDGALDDDVGIPEVATMSDEVFALDWLSADDEAAWKDL